MDSWGKKENIALLGYIQRYDKDHVLGSNGANAALKA